MGAFADAFGFTPQDVFHLTLPQITAYGRYMESKGEGTPDRPSQPSGTSSVDSLDQMVAMFGSPESKQQLAERMMAGATP